VYAAIIQFCPEEPGWTGFGRISSGRLGCCCALVAGEGGGSGNITCLTFLSGVESRESSLSEDLRFPVVLGGVLVAELSLKQPRCLLELVDDSVFCTRTVTIEQSGLAKTVSCFVKEMGFVCQVLEQNMPGGRGYLGRRRFQRKRL
jgi:hypothetical protein